MKVEVYLFPRMKDGLWSSLFAQLSLGEVQATINIYLYRNRFQCHHEEIKNRTIIRWILFDYHKYVYLYRASTIFSVITSCSVLKSCTKAKNNSYHSLPTSSVWIWGNTYLQLYFLQIVFVFLFPPDRICIVPVNP